MSQSEFQKLPSKTINVTVRVSKGSKQDNQCKSQTSKRFQARQSMQQSEFQKIPSKTINVTVVVPKASQQHKPWSWEFTNRVWNKSSQLFVTLYMFTIYLFFYTQTVETTYPEPFFLNSLNHSTILPKMFTATKTSFPGEKYTYCS